MQPFFYGVTANYFEDYFSLKRNGTRILTLTGLPFIFPGFQSGRFRITRSASSSHPKPIPLRTSGLVTFPFSSTIKQTKTCPSTPSDKASIGYLVDFAKKASRFPWNSGFSSGKSTGIRASSFPPPSDPNGLLLPPGSPPGKPPMAPGISPL